MTPYPLRRAILVFLATAAIGLRAAETTTREETEARTRALLAEGEPTIKTWVAAEFPAQAPANVNAGNAIARIIVDETGAVSAARALRASDPALGDAAVAAVKQWTFAPGISEGKPTAMCLDVRFDFARGKKAPHGLLPDERHLPHAVARTPATLEDGPLGEYPSSLIGRGLPGDIVFGCLVGPDGRASGIRILRASHPDFVLPALESSRQWRFNPATQGDLKLAAEMRGSVVYGDVKTPPREQVLAANGITAPDGGAPEAFPQPIAMADPIWPYEALIKGEAGSAAVEFTVSGNGSVGEVHVREASAPGFGAALAAAVQTWVFQPAVVHGVGTEVKLVKRQEFKPVAKDATDDSDWLSRLVRLARTGGIQGGRGVDAKLTPIYTVAPANPGTAPAGTKPEAVIDFVIDRDGRARLPKIVSATADDYGWAAATAVSQWVFVAPTRGGQPTEVKVRIPVGF